MADKKIILEVELIEGNAQSKLNELNASLKSLDKTHKDYKPTLQLIAQAERDLAKAQQNRILVEKGLTSSTTKVDKATKNTAKQMKQLSSDTGASTSATLELGRVFSDAPYGIRGVANNIQQLASNLFFMSKKTNEATGKSIGFGGALMSLGKNLIGPAGILVAFQAGVALLDYFKVGMDKAEESSEKLNESLKKEIDVLNGYTEALKNSNISLADREGIVKAATISSPEFLKIIKETSSSTEEQVKALANFIKGKKDELKIKEKVAEFDKAGKLIIDSEIKDRDEINRKIEEYRIQISKINETHQSQGAIIGLKRKIKKLQDVNTAYDTQVRVVKELNKLIAGEGKEDEEEEGKLGKLTKELGLKKKLRESLSNDKREYEAYTIVIEGLQKRIDKIRGTVKDRDKVIGLDLDSIGIGEEAKKGKKMLKAVADAMGIDMKKDPLEIDTNLDLTLSPEAKKMSADALKSQVDEMSRQSKLEDLASYAEKAKEIIGGMGDFANAEFDRELTIEQNKTNALNNELNIRLQNENLSKEQRQSIQNQIAQNDEKLRVKQEQIERKRFTMQKAVNIAQATMDTFVAATGVLAQTKGGSFARIAGMIATIGAGLAQVAMISRQKFQTSAGSSPAQATGSSSSGGGARSEASFNIVGGRTKEDALLGAIQDKFDQPIRAFVVSGDVTNQQQLDRVIVSSSSI